MGVQWNEKYAHPGEPSGWATVDMLSAMRRAGSCRKVVSMADQLGGQDFDELYRDERAVGGLPALTPWDIGEPQPVVQQLVAWHMAL